MPKKSQIRTKKILLLARRALPYYEDSIVKIREFIDSVKNKEDAKYYIDQFEEALRRSMQHFGVKVMAETIRFVFDQNFRFDSYDLLFISKCLYQNREDILLRTVKFIRQNDITPWHFTSFCDGIARYGEAEIEKGMDLAPYPLATDPYVPMKEFFNREYAQRRERFGIHVANLGYEKVNELNNFLLSLGLDAWQTLFLIGQIDDYKIERRAQREAQLNQAISIIKDEGLEVKGFLFCVFEALHERHGTASEIRAILKLAKVSGIEYFHPLTRDLELALHSYRQPGAREMVKEAASLDGLWMLNNLRAHLGLAISLALAFGETDLKTVAKNLRGNIDTEAHAIAQEILEPKYAKLGIFGPEKELVSFLSLNPLIIPEFWAKGASISKRNIVLEFEKRFGTEMFSKLMRVANESSEYEIATSITKVHPERLFEILTNVGQEYRPAIIRSINWYGKEKTRCAIDFTIQHDLDPYLFLPFVRGISVKSKYLRVIRPDNHHKNATASDEVLLKAFLSEPFEKRQTLGRAIKLFRRVETTMWWRIATEHV